MADAGTWIGLFIFAIIATLALLVLFFWFTWRTSTKAQAVSPYTGFPLRRTTELPYYAYEKVFQYLNSYHQYDNRIFELNKGAFCRETGRIFQDAVTWYDVIKVDWGFLRKRHPGYWVSWGSLTNDQQRLVREAHDYLDGYQTENSCPYAMPKAITPEYIYTKPGPLYVDFETKTLLGWKVVPGTELEVLIVQKPVK